MSFNQPGPYGQPNPNPYGQGGAPGQPGYGYPQQPPAPAYGQPPQPGPYGQQPPAPPYGAPQQGGWGQPQPGPYGQQPGMPGQYPPPMPPQSGGGKGKAIGITIGALVVVGAIVGGVLFFKNGGGGSDGKVAPYTIVLPDSLLDGKFNKQQTPGTAGSENLADDAKAKEMGITNSTGVAAAYKNAEQQALSVRGIYGEVADPRKTVDAMFALMDEKSKATGATVETVTPVTEFHPSGFDGAVMKCKTLKSTYSMAGITANSEGSTCVWGDSSAIGFVSHSVTKTSGGITGGATTTATGNPMSAKELSEAAAKVRTEVRKNK
ncbi:proline-rich domain-containing protein [Streptomyces sp. NPDC002537]